MNNQRMFNELIDVEYGYGYWSWECKACAEEGTGYTDEAEAYTIAFAHADVHLLPRLFATGRV